MRQADLQFLDFAHIFRSKFTGTNFILENVGRFFIWFSIFCNIKLTFKKCAFNKIKKVELSHVNVHKWINNLENKKEKSVNSNDPRKKKQSFYTRLKAFQKV